MSRFTFMFIAYILLLTNISSANGQTEFFAPPPDATHYSFDTLTRAASTLTPRAIVEAVNAPVRTPNQTALWNTLGQPESAILLSRRIPTDFERDQHLAATNADYSTTAKTAPRMHTF